jgi:hypothetical protein
MRKVLLIIAFLNGTQIFSQTSEDSVEYHFNNQKLNIILDSVQRITPYHFAYNSSIIPTGSRFTYHKKNTIYGFLDDILVGTDLEYVFYEDQIILKTIVEVENGTYSVRGKVTSAEDGKVLSGASVYLDGTLTGTSTDDQGHYSLDQIRSGSYHLVISHVGYETRVFRITSLHDKTKEIDVSLSPWVINLDSVEITEDRVEVKQEIPKVVLNSFQKNFLGYSDNARRCELINPEVLYFNNRQTNSLEAYSLQPLEVVNKALGYRLHFELDQYQEKNDTVKFYGKVKFGELMPEDRREKRRISKNRKKAFYGSMNHFLLSLMQRNVDEEDFLVFELKPTSYTRINLNSRKLIKRINQAEYIIDLDYPLMVVYTDRKYINTSIFDRSKKELQDKLLDYPYLGELLEKRKRHQVSIIESLKDPVIIDRNGNFKTPLNFILYGYWSFERTADLMPVNYNVNE